MNLPLEQCYSLTKGSRKCDVLRFLDVGPRPGAAFHAAFQYFEKEFSGAVTPRVDPDPSDDFLCFWVSSAAEGMHESHRQDLPVYKASRERRHGERTEAYVRNLHATSLYSIGEFSPSIVDFVCGDQGCTYSAIPGDAIMVSQATQQGGCVAESAERLSHNPSFEQLKERELLFLSSDPALQATDDIVVFLEDCARFRTHGKSPSERRLARLMMNFWSDFLMQRTGYFPSIVSAA